MDGGREGGEREREREREVKTCLTLCVYNVH